MAGRKKGATALTPLELRILQVLWQRGAGSVQDVQKSLSGEGELAYNTVQTMLNVLQRKGRVERELSGRAYVYRAVATRESVVGQAVRDLVDRLFGGSSEALVMNLIHSEQVNLEQIERLSRELTAGKEGEDE